MKNIARNDIFIDSLSTCQPGFIVNLQEQRH